MKLSISFHKPLEGKKIEDCFWTIIWVINDIDKSLGPCLYLMPIQCWVYYYWIIQRAFVRGYLVKDHENKTITGLLFMHYSELSFAVWQCMCKYMNASHVLPGLNVLLFYFLLCCMPNCPLEYWCLPWAECN